MTTRDRLLILSPSLGTVSETFITRHCTDLHSRTTFATFRVESGPSEFSPETTTVLPEAPRPTATVVARAVNRLRSRQRRHAARDVWWLLPDAVDRIVEHVEHAGTTSVLMEYLDRWLNAIPAVKELGVRIIAHGHGYDISSAVRNPATRRAYREFLPIVDQVVVPSQFAKRRLIELGVTNVTAIPYGIETDQGDASALYSPRRIVYLVAVGRLVPKKDPVGLLRVVAMARSHGVDLELDLIGDGPLRPQVERTVDQLRLADSVRVLGAQPNGRVLATMREADIFIQKSVTAPGGDEEGLPLAILEAMRASLPVVSTLHAGIPEAVVSGETGFLFDEDDVAGLAEGVVTYARDSDLRHEHGQAGRDRLCERFSWSSNRAALRHVLFSRGAV